MKAQRGFEGKTALANKEWANERMGFSHLFVHLPIHPFAIHWVVVTLTPQILVEPL